VRVLERARPARAPRSDSTSDRGSSLPKIARTRGHAEPRRRPELPQPRGEPVGEEVPVPGGACPGSRSPPRRTASGRSAAIAASSASYRRGRPCRSEAKRHAGHARALGGDSRRADVLRPRQRAFRRAFALLPSSRWAAAASRASSISRSAACSSGAGRPDASTASRRACASASRSISIQAVTASPMPFFAPLLQPRQEQDPAPVDEVVDRPGRHDLPPQDVVLEVLRRTARAGGAGSSRRGRAGRRARPGSRSRAGAGRPTSWSSRAARTGAAGAGRGPGAGSRAAPRGPAPTRRPG
jgi:hypothetical protein